MRKILLASAVFCLTAGMAYAQTIAKAPAPEGAVNAPVTAPPGDAIGKTAPNTPSGSVSTMPGATPGSYSSSVSGSAPAPEGATNGPVETPAGGAAGKTTPPPGGTTP